MDRLHAYGYFLEGLLPVLNRADCARAFQEGIGRMGEYLREIAPLFARSDVYAQLLRARLYGASLGVAPLDAEAALHEVQDAVMFQLPCLDSRGPGGFLFGRKCGQTLPFVNPVSTAFCAQALAFWSDHQNDEMNARHHDLI
jgi:hypothetical protein